MFFYLYWDFFWYNPPSEPSSGSDYLSASLRVSETHTPSLSPTNKPSLSPSSSPTFETYIVQLYLLPEKHAGNSLQSRTRTSRMCKAHAEEYFDSYAFVNFADSPVSSLLVLRNVSVIMDDALVAHDWDQFLELKPPLHADDHIWLGEEFNDCGNWSRADAYGTVYGGGDQIFACDSKFYVLCVATIRLS